MHALCYDFENQGAKSGINEVPLWFLAFIISFHVIFEADLNLLYEIFRDV